MEQSTKKIGLINWVALLIATIGMLLIARFVNSRSRGDGHGHSGRLWLVVTLISYFQMGLIGREQFEKLELEELSKIRGGASLFAEAAEPTPSRPNVRVEQF